MSIVGQTYYERGEPVVIVTQWRTGTGPNSLPCGPRNVKIRRADGTEVVRPFRGLRKVAPPAAAKPEAPTTNGATSARLPRPSLPAATTRNAT